MQEELQERWYVAVVEAVQVLRKQWCCMKPINKILFGYTRDKKGNVTNYHSKEVANTIHTFTGGGWTTDQIVGVIFEN